MMGTNTPGALGGSQPAANRPVEEKSVSVTTGTVAVENLGGISELELDGALVRNDWLGKLFGEAFNYGAPQSPDFAS